MTDGESRDDVPVWTRDVAALLFDCDGVLVDSDGGLLSAWTRWALHYDLDPDVVHPQVHGRRSADTVAALLPVDVAAEGTELIDRFELGDAARVRAILGAVELTAALPAERWAVVMSGTRALASARLGAAGIVALPVLLTANDLRQGKRRGGLSAGRIRARAGPGPLRRLRGCRIRRQRGPGRRRWPGGGRQPTRPGHRRRRRDRRPQICGVDAVAGRLVIMGQRLR